MRVSLTKLCIVALAIAAACFVVAQDDQQDNSAAMKRSRAYHTHRLDYTEPSWSLSRVKTLIKGIKPSEYDESKLADSQFNALSFRQKFTYTMIHPEDFDQNCNGMPEIEGEEHMIFGWLPDNVGQMAWSERQNNFLKNNRSRVLALVRQMMHEHRHVGLNLKKAICQLDAYSMIPDIVQAYRKDPADLDLLTTLFLLMKDGKYQPFLASQTYRKCYSDEGSYKAYIEANPANVNLTIQRAQAFYRSRM